MFYPTKEYIGFLIADFEKVAKQVSTARNFEEDEVRNILLLLLLLLLLFLLLLTTSTFITVQFLVYGNLLPDPLVPSSRSQCEH